MKYIVALLALAIGAFAITVILNIGGVNVWPFNEPIRWESQRQPFVQSPPGGEGYPVNRFYEHIEPVKFPGGELRFIHRVTWDSKDELYVYFYKLENLSDKTVLVSWGVLDEAFRNDKPLIHKLGPNTPLELTLKSKAQPLARKGDVVLFISEGETAYMVAPGPYVMGPVPGAQAVKQEEPEEEPEE